MRLAFPLDCANPLPTPCTVVLSRWQQRSRCSAPPSIEAGREVSRRKPARLQSAADHYLVVRLINCKVRGTFRTLNLAARHPFSSNRSRHNLKTASLGGNTISRSSSHGFACYFCRRPEKTDRHPCSRRYANVIARKFLKGGYANARSRLADTGRTLASSSYDNCLCLAVAHSRREVACYSNHSFEQVASGVKGRHYCSAKSMVTGAGALVTSAPAATIGLMVTVSIMCYFLIDNWVPSVGFWDNIFTAKFRLLKFRVSYLTVLAGATAVTCAAIIRLIVLGRPGNSHSRDSS